jgi:hypothetical protein
MLSVVRRIEARAPSARRGAVDGSVSGTLAGAAFLVVTWARSRAGDCLWPPEHDALAVGLAAGALHGLYRWVSHRVSRGRRDCQIR